MEKSIHFKLCKLTHLPQELDKYCAEALRAMKLHARGLLQIVE